MRTLLVALLFVSQFSFAEAAKTADASQKTETSNTDTLVQQCVNSLKAFPGGKDTVLLERACQRAQVKKECVSVKGTPIYHVDKESEKKGQRILVFSLIHGDETGAGTVARLWMERMEKFDPRNTWRIVPILNPDGVGLKTRTNANNIDLNRNFPTRDWDQLAQKYWKIHGQSSPRRFPGNVAGSEPETRCALAHIDEFKPDFIVSVHTPLNVLDFDGPDVHPPKYDYLPWKSLGHFPGSLGRYMWFERSVPVLTAELKPSLPKNLEPLMNLQDVVGSLSHTDNKGL